MNIIVQKIASAECEPWLLKKHYARRMCPVSFAYGAYRDNELIGVVTYGVPVSSSLRSGICGEEWKDNVLELNRLCCENTKNIASILVGRSLQMLPPPKVVVSFADIAQGHVGYVYQATNWTYTGLSAKRTDWMVEGLEHLHGATIADQSRKAEGSRVEFMRSKYGDRFYLKDRPRKHRYVFLVGNKPQKKAMSASLLYRSQPYPKGDSRHYDSSAKVETQMILFAGDTA